ncbi:MAG: lytic transglycosylase domain-containing protein [Spirochaetaceae bacterium]|nr:MAG: lytic transglycosylase domain-containing protein [Spirochaetaceae bacterium]
MLGCSTTAYEEKEEVEFISNENVEQRGAIVASKPEVQHWPEILFPLIDRTLNDPDPGLALYRNPATRELVQDFFVELTGSKEVALPILYHANRQDVPLFLAFSLVQAESSFQIDAVNRNPYSIDRGLFQLNSRSFPQLRNEDFFHPDTNVFHGVSYMRYTLDSMGDVERALAMYNAGRSRVESNSIPESTKLYVRRILENREELREKFRSYLLETFSSSV